jgi:ElaB/YqjD/DUF883 family membrane-anchored ribosome-binding protein
VAKRTAGQPSGSAKPKPAASEAAKQQAEQSPEIKQAADAVRRAEAELQKAQQLYQKVRQDATDRLRVVREKRVGELVDGTLEAVRKYPGPGLILAALVGFFLGRLFRR